jgi:hypothetical protein
MRWVKRWQKRMKRRRRTKRTVRARKETTEADLAYALQRSPNDGLGGGAKKAIAKSLEDDGHGGVTMMAGRGDFSVMVSRERSAERAQLGHGHWAKTYQGERVSGYSRDAEEACEDGDLRRYS